MNPLLTQPAPRPAHRSARGAAAPSVAPARPMLKCISLGGPAPLRFHEHPHDYEHHLNREYVRVSGTDWVKLWVSWELIQADFQPACWEESWGQLNVGPTDRPFAEQAALRSLDRQIALAKADGLGVLVTIHHELPHWATGQPEEPEPKSRPPLDCSTSGPWAWFVSHLCARYKPGAPPNPYGPHAPLRGEASGDYDPWAGNPDGATVDALEICNEPNLRWRPDDRLHETVAEMLVTADEISTRWGGPAIFGPGTSDLPGGRDLPYDPGEEGVPAATFTERVLGALDGWEPAGGAGWTHHNYRDVHEGTGERVAAVRRLLADHGRGDAERPSVWLTEGGYRLPDLDGLPCREANEHKLRQADMIEMNFSLMRELGAASMWTQHGINDLPLGGPRSGLRENFDFHYACPGEPRPAFARWAQLSG